MFASTKTELRMPNAFYKPNTLAIPINSQHLQKWSQMITNPRNLLQKGAWLVFCLFHSIEKIWPHNFDIEPFLLKSHLVLAHLCQILASEQISFKLFIKCMFASTKTELRMPNAFYKPNTLAIPINSQHLQKWSQMITNPRNLLQKGAWLVFCLFHSIEKIWPHNFDIEPFLLKSHLVLAHLCQILASEQISFKLFIKWLSDHVCVDKDRITDAKCIL